MNTKILVIFIIVLLGFLLLPVVMNIIRATGGVNTSAAADMPAGPKAPPKLNNENLVGSAWSVKTPEMPIAVTISLNAGGQAVAQVPAMFRAIAVKQLGTDTLTGTWSAQGDKLTATITLKGKTNTVACDIVGDQVYYAGKALKRIN